MWPNSAEHKKPNFAERNYEPQSKEAASKKTWRKSGIWKLTIFCLSTDLRLFFAGQKEGIAIDFKHWIRFKMVRFIATASRGKRDDELVSRKRTKLSDRTHNENISNVRSPEYIAIFAIASPAFYSLVSSKYNYWTAKDVVLKWRVLLNNLSVVCFISFIQK